ncbi:hypothetical protein IAE19_06470 [Acinetobacter sp. S40]|nr:MULTISPECIES: hypothetical protein [unclassified Acinetobacter]MBJ9985087.1 hypothetical protein [Acinetobacter sp. S40]MBK0062921.1 hypothetical protein [Acinetobacter sp. S55]MBK0066661.1 hypothetical protein [Acinetobacter sp. S54]
MRTTVKYVVLKGDDYQLGTPLHEENLETGSTYFDNIPSVVTFNGRDFRVKYKELIRKQTFDENDESQHILVKMIAMN